MQLSDFESIILSYARRFASTPNEIEDLEQVGRIAAWNVHERYPDKPKPYIITSIKQAMLSHNRFSRAQKRTPAGGIISLNTPIFPDSELTLEDSLGNYDEHIFDMDSRKSLYNALKNKNGKYWIKHISNNTNNPKAVIRKIVRTAIEEVAGYSPKDIPEKVDYQFFVDFGLGAFLWAFYNNSPFRAVNDAYQKEFLPWQFKRVSSGFWKGKQGQKNIKLAMDWFIKIKKIDSTEACSKINVKDFEDAGLSFILQKYFHSSPNLALSTVFTDLKPWQSNRTKVGYFDNIDNQREALQWFNNKINAGDIYQLTPEETYDTPLRDSSIRSRLAKEGLSGLINNYGNSPYELYLQFYPDQILPWTLRSMKNPWKNDPKKTAGEAIKWLFDIYLKIPVEEIPDYASTKLFWNVGFSGILTNRQIGFSSSTFLAVNNAYPDIFRPEQFARGRHVKQYNQNTK